MAAGYSNKKKEQTELDVLKQDFAAGTHKNVYVFYGEERYLLMHYLGELRKLVPEDTQEFNYRRLEGKGLNMHDLSEAVDSLPVFCDATLTEVWDFDFGKLSEDTRSSLTEILSDVPEYAHIVFVSETVEFKLDGRVKANAALKKLLNPVEFSYQGPDILLKWIPQHFRTYGKTIDRANTEYLSFITGGDMTALSGEISKIAAYADDKTVTRQDIDAVVIPIVDAQGYELTDAILSGNRELAVKKLGDLLGMNEAPHKILFTIAMRIRQLLCAKVFQESGRNIRDFMAVCGIKYEFQAKGIFAAAKKINKKACIKLNMCVSETAYKLNSSSQNGGELLKELLVKLIVYSKAA